MSDFLGDTLAAALDEVFFPFSLSIFGTYYFLSFYTMSCHASANFGGRYKSAFSYQLCFFFFFLFLILYIYFAIKGRHLFGSFWRLIYGSTEAFYSLPRPRRRLAGDTR